jgi:thiol-disulfide isomerase/thioredoxin
MLPEHEGYTGDGSGQVGDHIDAFLLPDQFGDAVDYRQFLGFVTVIELGATWCSPCQEAARTQQDFAVSLASAGPTWVISMLLQDINAGPPDTGDTAQWALEFDLDLPVLADELQTHQNAWGITAWPTSLVVAPDGTVLSRHEGATDETVLEADVLQALVNWADLLQGTP